MKRKIVMTFVLAAALAFTPVGGQLAMTVNASESGTLDSNEGGADDDGVIVNSDIESIKDLIRLEWVDGKPTISVDSNVKLSRGAFLPYIKKEGSGGDVLAGKIDIIDDEGKLASDVYMNYIIHEMEEMGSGTYCFGLADNSNKMVLSSEYEYVKPAEDSDKGTTGTEDKRVVLGWTEDGKPTIEAVPEVRQYLKGSASYRIALCKGDKEVGIITELTCDEEGNLVTDAYVNRVVSLMEKNGSGTYYIHLITSADGFSPITFYSPKYEYIKPAEEPPAEDSSSTESSGGSTREESSFENNAVITSAGVQITSTVPMVNMLGVAAAVVSSYEEIAAAAGLAPGETLIPTFRGVYDQQAQQAVEAAAASAGVNLVYTFDLSVCIGGRDDSGSVKQLNAPVRFTMEAPNGIDGNAYDFVVIRIHDGKSDILPDLDDDPKTVTFATDRFSAYGLTYTDKGKAPRTKDSVPKTGDALPVSASVTGIVSIAAFGAMLLLGRKKEQR